MSSFRKHISRTASLDRAATRRRRLAAIAAALVLAAVWLAGSTPALAGPPPSAIGNPIHGFLLDDGVYTTIDHPDADPVPLEGFVGGSGVGGINNRGDVVGSYLGADRRGHGYLRAGRSRVRLEKPR